MTPLHGSHRVFFLNIIENLIRSTDKAFHKVARPILNADQAAHKHKRGNIKKTENK